MPGVQSQLQVLYGFGFTVVGQRKRTEVNRHAQRAEYHRLVLGSDFCYCTDFQMVPVIVAQQQDADARQIDKADTGRANANGNQHNQQNKANENIQNRQKHIRSGATIGPFA